MTTPTTYDLARNVTIPLDRLRAHPENYQRHDPVQIERLALSLRSFGQVADIVVHAQADGSYVTVAGHGLAEAARSESWPSLQAVVFPVETPQEVIVAYLVADNELARLADPDQVALAALLDRYREGDIPLKALGYTTDELDDLVANLGDAVLAAGTEGRDAADPSGGGDDFDATPETGPTRTHVGDIWHLGRHRLLVGDSTDTSAVARLMGDDRAACLWTDPPYGVNYVGKTKDALTIHNDGKNDVSVLLAAAFHIANEHLKPGSSIYIAHPAGALSVVFAQSFLAAGWHLHETLVWVKDSMVLGHSDYHYRHEPILYGYTPGGGRRGRGGEGWYGDNAQTSVFEIPRPKRSTDHPTMKPVALVSAMLVNSCPVDGIVYEPFAGSGTTLIACERLGMQCRAVELDPRFADVILRRWETETGQAAVLIASDSTQLPEDTP